MLCVDFLYLSRGCQHIQENISQHEINKTFFALYTFFDFNIVLPYVFIKFYTGNFLSQNFLANDKENLYFIF